MRDHAIRKSSCPDCVRARAKPYPFSRERAFSLQAEELRNMSTLSAYNNKVLLLIGSTRLITEAVVRHFLEQGVGQVRAYSGDEEGLTALRDGLQADDAAAAARLRYYVGDVNDPAYLAEAMDGVDFVLYAPTNKSERECDEDPAEACTALLEPVNVVMDTATQQKVQNLVVVGQDYSEPLSDTRSLIAALLEKVVVAQGCHQNEKDDTSICYVRPMDGDNSGLVDISFAKE